MHNSNRGNSADGSVISVESLAKEYRVGSWPLVYVLDGERKIHYVGAPGSFVELTAEALLAEVKPAAK